MQFFAAVQTDIFLQGDCEKVLANFPENSIDLILTSPPYADARKGKYEGVPAAKYVDWFLPKAEQFRRVLKPKGTFILNIKEPAKDGERQTFVIDLILALRKQGWFWTEEFVWHKKNSFPGKWPNRFRDGWERLLQFNKTKKFRMFQNSVKVKMGDWAKPRLKKLSEKDREREHSTLNDFGVNLERFLSRKKAFPDNVLHLPSSEEFEELQESMAACEGFRDFLLSLSKLEGGRRIVDKLGQADVVKHVLNMLNELETFGNVLHLPTECANKGHAAVFPVALPEWFIKLFTAADDIVLDPFSGSGTTALAAYRLGRHYVGVDVNETFVKLATDRLTLAKASQTNGNGTHGILKTPRTSKRTESKRED